MNTKNTQYKGVDALLQELRRGVVVLAVLSQLDEERYGYSLIQQLTGRGFEIDQGTLYPLLRRLESKGLLESEWRVEGSRPRRYYRISPVGRDARAALTDGWRTMGSVMESLLANVEGGNDGIG